MQLYVPELGDEIRLTSDWPFALVMERRNDSVIKLFDRVEVNDPPIKEQLDALNKERKEIESRISTVKLDTPYGYSPRSYQKYASEDDSHRHRVIQREIYDLGQIPSWKNVKLPTGTVLKIDRIYIRKGASDYSSITFMIKELDGKKMKGLRFWAKLCDCNDINFEKVST